MKTCALLICGALSLVTLGTASAEPVRVRVTARISEINDSGQVLAGRLVIGQRVTGTYVYNTNTPNDSNFPANEGHYLPFAGEARMRFVTGGLVFESVQPTQQIELFVHPHGNFWMFSNENLPLADGTHVDSIFLDLQGDGNVTQSTALANVAPDLANYFDRNLTLSGSSGSSFFSVRARLEVAELIVAQAVDISPAAGEFVPGQHFDAALLLPRGSVVSFARASANGNGVGLQYPGSCQLLPPNSAGKPGILCPGADAALAIAGGAPIDWNVELTNGSMLTESVDWHIIQ